MPGRHEDESLLENLIHSVREASSAQFVPPPSASSAASSFFSGRGQQMHDFLGGGHSADVLLWRKKHLSASTIVGSAILWVVFEWIGYHFVSVISFVLLVAIVFVFLWSYTADLLNRDPPAVPRLQISDQQVLEYGKLLKTEINRLLAILHDIALGKDLKQFLKLAGILSFLVVFGTWFHFLTLLLLAVIAAHTMPLLYEKHGDSIDNFANIALKEVANQYKFFDEAILSKIPRKQPSWRKRD